MSDEQVQLSRIEAALTASGDLIYDWDFVSDRIRWCGPVAALFGHVSAELVGTGDRFHARVSAGDLSLRLKALARHFSGHAPFDCEYRLKRSNGDSCWVHDRGVAEFDGSGNPLRMVGTLRVVTASKQREERFEYLANFDELTGHYNKTRLREAVQHALSQSERYGTAGAFLVIDIDNLTMINDAFGHGTGDAVIIGLGERLDRCIGASDVIGRVEGDQFGILLDGCNDAQVAAMAERIMRTVRQAPMQTGAGPIAVTVSVGGVVFPHAAQTPYDVMTRAVTALLQAKRGGRNHFALYQLTETERRGLRRDMAIVKLVQDALSEDRLLLAYQPIVSAQDHTVAFHECVLRLRAEDGRIMTAGEFIPVVEQLGLIRQIDRRVLELAVETLIDHPEATLACNISGLTAADHAWLRGLVALLKGRPDVAQRLIVEVTETAALQDLEESARFVASVRDLGCRVALDDFGAGYSSFRHLKALTVDIVKIDGSYVSNIMESADNQLFIRTLLGLAEGFGLKTIAECVETEAEATLLAKHGVTYLQGYHFGAPELGKPWPPAAAGDRRLVASGASAA